MEAADTQQQAEARWESIARAFPFTMYLVNRAAELHVAARASDWLEALRTVPAVEAAEDLHVEETYFDIPEFQEITVPTPTPRQAVRELAETLDGVGLALQSLARRLSRLAEELEITATEFDAELSPVSPWEVEHQSRVPGETDAR
jgi:hypothetical protein